MNTSNALSSVAEWRSAGERLATNLRAERDTLAARIQEIDQALSALGLGDSPRSRRGPSVNGEAVRDATVAFVRETPGALSREICQATGISRRMLSYFATKGLIRREGTRRWARWYVVDGAAQ